MVPHTPGRRQPSHQRRKSQRSRRRRKPGNRSISNKAVATSSPGTPSEKHVKGTEKLSIDKNLDFDGSERIKLKATMNVTFDIKAGKTRTDNDETEQSQNQKEQNVKGDPAEACRYIQQQQAVIGKGRWALRNRRVFSSSGARIGKRGCGKKKTGRSGSSPNWIMSKIRQMHQNSERGCSQESETEYTKEGKVTNCKSESDGTDIRSLSKNDKLSRSLSISDSKQYLYDNGEDGDARSEDDGEDPRILELEDAITRTAERCALLQEKIDATNRANSILRDSARAAGFI